MQKYTNATDNSREVMPGGLFISMPADNAQNYLNDAKEHGAAAVIMPSDSKLVVPKDIVVIKSDDIAADSAKIAAQYYPDAPKHICAITGTKGKTSIVSFIIQILKMLNKNAASIGTLGIVSEKWVESGSNTTPFAIQLCQWMSKLADNGVEYLAVEASSHGIEQKRLEYIDFDAVGFSNLSREHLDYHKTMDNYFSAKARLFSDFNYKTAVINFDDEFAKKIKHHADSRLISVGRNGFDMKIIGTRVLPDGQEIELNYFGKIIQIKATLIGEFQIYNALMAIGLVIGMGIDKDNLPIEAIFENLHAPAGRAEFVGKTKTGGAVFVDYAHTPASLEQIIESLRKHATNRLHILFGCGGNRDTGKRPMMGKIAADKADIVYITDDNPRMEDAGEIRKQIIAACPNGIEIANRADAIRTAVNKLSDGDILIIAGKGHEDYQIIGKEKTHFSDREEVLKYL